MSLPRPTSHLTLPALLASAALALTACGGSPADTRPSSDDPASETTSSSSGAKPEKVSINTSGDLLWNPRVFAGVRTADGGYDFSETLISLRPFLEASDLAICHQEVVIGEDGGPYTGYPRFRVPAETVQAVADAGFDVCTTASNHTVDDGWDGVVRTLGTLHEHGIETAGSSKTLEEDRAPDLFTTDSGAVVGIVSQTYSLNDLEPPVGREWTVDLIDTERAVADARAARDAGADIVIYHMHAGDEYTHIPNAEQVATAEAVTASGEVDLVIGQHPHWTQPIDKVNGVYVVYSTGNLMTSMPGERPGTHDGAAVQADFERGDDGTYRVSGLTWTPTFITDAHNDPTGRPRTLAIPDELAAAEPGLRARLEASAARTRDVLQRAGVDGLDERTAKDVAAEG